jgi:ferredoxin
MALLVDPIVTFKHTSTEFIIIDSTGDYNAVTNPKGWGSPNEARSALTAISTIATSPAGTTVTIVMTGGNFDNDTYRAQDLAPSLSMTDGIWKFDTTFAVGANSETISTYTLRDAVLKCTLGKLALSNFACDDYFEIKLMYDKMIQAMECGEYVLAEELYADIEKAIDNCPNEIKKSCGC